MPVFDKIGQEIKKGDIIAYGHNLDRCAGLRIGKVLENPTVEEFPNYYHLPINGSTTKFVYRIKVWGINDDWEYKTTKLLTKSSMLQYPNRVVVLDPTKIKPEFKTLLDSIKVLP